MDVEIAARAAFEALHRLHNRPRHWDTHPDGDQDVEMGRDTFRHMMEAAIAAAQSAAQERAQGEVREAAAMVQVAPVEAVHPVEPANDAAPAPGAA